MNYKPWPIIVLAIFHFIEPLTKISFFSLYYMISPLEVFLAEMRTGQIIHIIEFFFLFPIAGLAIIKVKKWSIPLFIAIQVWVIIANWNYLTFLYNSGQNTMLGFFILFLVINLAVVLFLLLPAVRIAYMDPRVRWWEAKPRYQITIPCQVDKSHQAEILNISESGVFIAENEKLETGSTISLDFNFYNQEFFLDAKVIHGFSINNKPGYGVQFLDLSKEEKLRLQRLLAAFEALLIDRRPARRDDWIDFKNWIKNLMAHGKGLFPERQHRKSEQ